MQFIKGSAYGHFHIFLHFLSLAPWKSILLTITCCDGNVCLKASATESTFFSWTTAWIASPIIFCAEPIAPAFSAALTSRRRFSVANPAFSEKLQQEAKKFSKLGSFKIEANACLPYCLIFSVF